MRKSFRHVALAVLSAAMLAGQTLTAFADQDPAHGPGVTQTTSISQESPGGSGNTSQSEASSAVLNPFFPNQQSSSETQTTEGQSQESTDAQAAETVQDPQLPVNPAFLQAQLLRLSDLTWTDAVRDDTVIQTGEQGFVSMCIYANNLPGDVLYRTYSSIRGWSRWAMNGAHSDWSPENPTPVEAVQIRLTGVFGNRFDIYYSSTLSDGTACGWSKAGGTNGAMASGRHITGLRLSMWGKGTEGANYNMSSPLVSAAPDGISFVDGTPVFSNGTGALFTGWVWNDSDRYYVTDNAIVTGWQYIDGYKYFFESNGKLVTDLEPYLNHPGPFELKINKQMNCTTVYIQDGENGFIIPYKTFLCSTGDDTPLGDHRTPEKYRWRLMNTAEYCQYCTRLDSGIPILLHSVIYSKPNPYTLKPFTYNYLGATPSHGCIRFTTADAKWIFDHCALGTKIHVYESPVPGPFDRPAIQTLIPDTQTWDPTDVNVPENGLQ